MALYLYECTRCGTRQQLSATIGDVPSAPDCECGGATQRSYRSEGVGLAIRNLKIERDPNFSERLFLPDASDFASPTDPDGQKGLREWNENNVPKEGNKNPRRPKVDKAVW
jgi:hypothetical protein